MMWICKKEYKKVNRKDLEFLMSFLGIDRVYVTDEIGNYLSEDELKGISIMPEVVVEAKNKDEIERIMFYAHQQNIPVVIREVIYGSIEYSDIVSGGIMINFNEVDKVS